MSSIRPAGAACSLSQSRRRSCKLPGSAQSAQPCSRRQAQCAPALQSARRRVWQPAAATAGAAAAGDAIANSAEAAAAVEGFCVSHDVPQGRLVIRPVQPLDVSPASVLLTRAFATSLQGVPLQDGRAYVAACLRQPPAGVLLVARLHPTDESLLPPGKSSRVVATCALSFSRATRENFPSLQPPDDAAYLSNMAVDVTLRRFGHARQMLAAAEALTRAAGHSCVWLHARLGDDAAQQLYLSSGYREVERDSFLAKLQGITPRSLMTKEL